MYFGRKVLVTGAGGFIGSHLTEALVREGAEVTAMIKYSSAAHWGNLEFADSQVKKSIKTVAGNIEDSDFVMHVAKDKEVIFHLAALIAIPYSYIAPRSYVRTNVEGTLNVLEAARRHGLGRVVHTSTSEVYGTALREPIDEEHPLQGQSPYSASKIGADKIAESYYRSFSTPIVTLRPFNTYGPRQSARAFIPTIISQALERDVIELGSLEPQRDMTFAADTVKGFLLAGTTKGIEGETINLGIGKAHSIKYFADAILSLMGSDKPILLDPKRTRPTASEVLKLISDNRKAKRLLGWEPQTALNEGLKESIAFVAANRSLFRSEIYNL